MKQLFSLKVCSMLNYLFLSAEAFGVSYFSGLQVEGVGKFNSVAEIPVDIEKFPFNLITGRTSAVMKMDGK